jgi:hypothetical protein
MAQRIDGQPLTSVPSSFAGDGVNGYAARQSFLLSIIRFSCIAHRFSLLIDAVDKNSGMALSKSAHVVTHLSHFRDARPNH